MHLRDIHHHHHHHHHMTVQSSVTACVDPCLTDPCNTRLNPGNRCVNQANVQCGYYECSCASGWQSVQPVVTQGPTCQGMLISFLVGFVWFGFGSGREVCGDTAMGMTRQDDRRMHVLLCSCEQQRYTRKDEAEATDQQLRLLRLLRL